MKKTCILLAVISVLLLMAGCKGERQQSVPEQPQEEAVAEPAYDLEALAKAIEGCDDLVNFKNGVAAFRRNGEWHYIDKLGRFVDPVPDEADEPVYYPGDEVFEPYQYHGDFHEGMCWVYSEADYGIGYINEQGELVIPCQYEWAVDHSPSNFCEGVCPVMTVPNRELFSYIDKTGALAFPGFYSTESSFSEGLAYARELYMDGDDVTGSQAGYIDHAGKMIIFLDNDCGGFPFHDGVAQVYNYMEHNAWFIDTAGRKLFGLDKDRYFYADDWPFVEGLCAIHDKQGRWAFFDKTGRSTFDN